MQDSRSLLPLAAEEDTSAPVKLTLSISTDRQVAATFSHIVSAFLKNSYPLPKIPHSVTSLFFGLVTWLCGLCWIFFFHIEYVFSDIW